MFNTFLKNHSFSDYNFSCDFFPTVNDRDFWIAFQNDTVVKYAEDNLDYGWPVVKATDFMEFKKSGDRVVMQTPHYSRRDHLVAFALAELKENEGRFLPQIVNGLFAICEETYWGVSAHRVYDGEFPNIPTPSEPYIDLFAAETAEHLTMICHLLHDPLASFCPEILDRVELEVEQRIKTPYFLHRHDYWWMGYAPSVPNNWNPWILSNVLTVFLLTEKNERRLHRALEKLFTEIQHYYDALPSDGGCDEGSSYWDRAGASLFEFVYLLKQSTGGALDLFDDEKLCLAASYLKKVHVAGDIFANVADSHAKGKAYLCPLLYGFARETKQTDIMNFSAQTYREYGNIAESLSHTVRTVRRLIYSSEFISEMLEYPVSDGLHEALECLPDVQLAVLRAGELSLVMKGGHNAESHNHNDVGSISLYDGKTPVLADIGINTYTRFTFDPKYRYKVIPWTRSPYHNLPIVNGTEQLFGKEHRADFFDAKEGGGCVSFAAAYPEESGLDSLMRVVSVSEDCVLFLDSFTFREDSPREVTEVLMSVLPVIIKDNAAIIDSKYIVTCEGATFSAETVPFEDASLESDWSTGSATRILMTVSDAKDVTVVIGKIPE